MTVCTAYSVHYSIVTVHTCHVGYEKLLIKTAFLFVLATKFPAKNAGAGSIKVAKVINADWDSSRGLFVLFGSQIYRQKF